MVKDDCHIGHAATNKSVETNRRPASPLDAWWESERAVHAQACLFGGGLSAFRSA